jgi:hypothetical protein
MRRYENVRRIFPMAQLDPVLFRQIPVIQKVIADEAWYEGERRGCYVPPDDPVVRDHVCEVILRIGRELRESILAQLAARPGPVMLRVQGPRHDEAA